MTSSEPSRENRPTILLIGRHLPDVVEGDRGLRILQYLRSLSSLGTEADIVVCSDRVLRAEDVERCEKTVPCRRIQVLDPTDVGIFQRMSRHLAGVLPSRLAAGLESGLDVPLRWKHWMRRLLREVDYSAIVVLEPGLTPLCRRAAARSTRILDLVDLGFDRGTSDGPWRRANFQEIVEHVDAFDRVLVPTETDARLWLQLGQTVPVSTLPYTGTGYSLERKGPQVRPPAVLLLSSDDPEDRDAVRYFRRKVFPRVLERVPSACLRIFCPTISEIDPSPDVELFDSPEVLERLFAESWVCVFPQRSGARARSWITESLCHGKACVATPSAAYGFDPTVSSGLVVAPSDRELGETVIRTLVDDAHREGLEADARAWVKNAPGPLETKTLLAEVLALPAVRRFPAKPSRAVSHH